MTIDIFKAPDGRVDFVRYLEPEAYEQVDGYIRSGTLPADTMFRLDSLGDRTPDPNDSPGIDGRSFRWKLILELAEHGDQPTKLTPAARRVVFGDQLMAMLVWNPDPEAHRLHTEFDPPFLIRSDLAKIIEERRIREGKTIKERNVPRDSRYRPAEHLEFIQCMRLAHGLWRALAGRIAPEYVGPNDLSNYYRPFKSTTRDGFRIDEGSDWMIMRREIVSAVALNVQHIKRIYDEAMDTKVIGIGPQGKVDLQTLLAEEYPELGETL